MKTVRPIVLASLLVSLLAAALAGGGGCATGKVVHKIRTPPSTPPTFEMTQAFQKAEELYFAKNFFAAEQVYHSYLSQFPHNTLTPKTWFRLGEIRFRNKDYQSAISFYKKSCEKRIDPEWGALALYKRAVSSSRLHEDRKVLSVLDDLPPDINNLKVALLAASLRVTTARRLQDTLQNNLEETRGYLELIDAYEAVSASEIETGDLTWIVTEKMAKEEIGKWIAQQGKGAGDIGQLKKWMERLAGKTSGGTVTWKSALLYYHKGDYKNAAAWTARYLQGYPKHEYRAAARALSAELERRGVTAPPEGGKSPVVSGRGFVGVLLPLSGKFAVYGESVLHGLECAAGIFAPCRGDLATNLLVRDTKGDPETAARIVGEFASNPEVKAVIGPLPQIETDQAVPVAEEARIPMVTLSQKPDVAKAGEFIFRNFLTIADQVATLVEYACGEKKWKKFAILTPEGATGEEYRKPFEEEVVRCGGRLVAQASYPPNSTSFTDAIRGLKFSSARQTAGGAAPFEALFVPDVYRKIPRIAQALRSEGMGTVTLMGGAGWNHPGLVKGGGAELEGAIFVDGFFARGSNYATRNFVSTFQATYGVEPTLLEAYAFDTMRLLGDLLKDHPGADRSELQKILAKKQNFPGVTGNISFDEDGDARRRLSILTIRGGEIVEVK